MLVGRTSLANAAMKARRAGPTRIAMVTPSLRGGGLERLVRDLTLSLDRDRFRPEVFCLNGLGVHAADLAAAGVPLWDCTEPRVRIRGVPGRLLARLAAFEPDLIHAHSGTWLGSAVAKTVLRYPRLVFTEHGRYPPEPRIRAVVERWCHRRTDRCVGVSTAVADYLQHFLGLARRPDVVANGIDLALYAPSGGSSRARLRREWGIGPDAVLAACIGRLVPVKDHLTLLHAMAHAVTEAPALRLAVIGSGPLERELRREAEVLGIADRVVFCGYRSDIGDCLRAADLFVNSSTTEGLPVSLLEALAVGVPVVATRVGGVPEALGDPTAGILVRASDSRALSDELVRVATSPSLRATLSERAANRAQIYSLQSFASRYSAMYSELLHEERA